MALSTNPVFTIEDPIVSMNFETSIQRDNTRPLELQHVETLKSMMESNRYKILELKETPIEITAFLTLLEMDYGEEYCAEAFELATNQFQNRIENQLMEF